MKGLLFLLIRLRRRELRVRINNEPNLNTVPPGSVRLMIVMLFCKRICTQNSFQFTSVHPSRCVKTMGRIYITAKTNISTEWFQSHWGTVTVFYTVFGDVKRLMISWNVLLTITLDLKIHTTACGSETWALRKEHLQK
jgi:hypothetical protein